MRLTHPHAPIVEHIRLSSNKVWNLTFNHTLREGNNGVDWFAKFGANMEHSFKILENCHPTLSHSLLVDASGVARMRV